MKIQIYVHYKQQARLQDSRQRGEEPFSFFDLDDTHWEVFFASS